MHASESPDIFQTIIHLGARRQGVYLEPPCDRAAIAKLQNEATRDLGAEVPQGYIELLRITNGLQINCAYFKSAENLVLDNLDVFREEIIVLGVVGNIAEFVFDKRDRRFHTINLGFPDEQFSSYDTFQGLLIGVLKEQQIV